MQGSAHRDDVGGVPWGTAGGVGGALGDGVVRNDGGMQGSAQRDDVGGGPEDTAGGIGGALDVGDAKCDEGVVGAVQDPSADVKPGGSRR